MARLSSTEIRALPALTLDQALAQYRGQHVAHYTYNSSGGAINDPTGPHYAVETGILGENPHAVNRLTLNGRSIQFGADDRIVPTDDRMNES